MPGWLGCEVANGPELHACMIGWKWGHLDMELEPMAGHGWNATLGSLACCGWGGAGLELDAEGLYQPFHGGPWGGPAHLHSHQPPTTTPLATLSCRPQEETALTVDHLSSQPQGWVEERPETGRPEQHIGTKQKKHGISLPALDVQLMLTHSSQQPLPSKGQCQLHLG
jgi:hypothetical protein